MSAEVGHRLAPVTELPRTDGAGRRVEPTLSDRPLRWIEGGRLTGWTPVYMRSRHAVDVMTAHHRLILTEVAEPRLSDATRRWLALQDLLVAAPQSDPLDRTVFWRIAINRRAFALGAQPCPSAEIALGRMRRLAKRARKLKVAFAYFEGEPLPRWVAHDNDVPVLVGLSDYHLAATADPDLSAAAVLADARVQRYVHQAGVGDTLGAERRR